MTTQGVGALVPFFDEHGNEIGPKSGELVLYAGAGLAVGVTVMSETATPQQPPRVDSPGFSECKGRVVACKQNGFVDERPWRWWAP